MATINSLRINHQDAINLIAASGSEITCLLQGQPGIGKSAILKELSVRFPDYEVAYIDCANLDLGDLGMPVIDRELMVTNYATNARFKLTKNSTKPVLLMLDELGKASRPVMNMLLPVILEHRIGDVHFPTGSITFATTNLATDGVGDNIPAHAYNRMTVVDLSNPSSEQWLGWANNNGVCEEIMLFAREFPQIFERYDDLISNDKNSNPYIFNPLRGNVRAFCSPRSLAAASVHVRNREKLGGALLAVLAGTIGEAAARDMEANIALADKLESFENIVKNPKKAKLPKGVGANFMMAFRLAANATAETLDAVMEYADRIESFEAKTLFMVTLASNTSKQRWAVANKTFIEECRKIGKYF